MRRTGHTIVMTALAAAIAFAPAARGQTAVDDVRAFIERNAELLAAAAELVHETNSSKARSLLETARQLHEQSVKLMDQNATGLAFRTAVRAREVIQQTVAVAKREARAEAQAHTAIERATARLEQARTLLEDSHRDDVNARRLIMEAAEHLHGAHDQMQQHMFETALRLAVSSSELSMRAIRVLRRDGAAGADVIDEIERTQEFLDRLADARPALSPVLLKLAEQAEALQRRAMESAERGDANRARDETQAARAIALRALRAAGPGAETGEERALRAVTLTDEVLERARGVAAEAADEALSRSLDEAARIQQTAHEALLRSDFGAATRLTTRAREIAREALRKVEAAVDPASVELALARTDDALARAQERLAAPGSDPEARALIERAAARQPEARAALASGDPRRALALTKVAHHLATQALRRMGDAGR